MNFLDKDDKYCEDCNIRMIGREDAKVKGKYCSIFDGNLTEECPCKVCLVKAMCKKTCIDRMGLRDRAHDLVESRDK